MDFYCAVFSLPCCVIEVVGYGIDLLVFLSVGVFLLVYEEDAKEYKHIKFGSFGFVLY